MFCVVGVHWYGVDGIYCLMGARLEYKLERGTRTMDFVSVFSTRCNAV
jgi:hypothetical protein